MAADRQLVKLPPVIVVVVTAALLVVSVPAFVSGGLKVTVALIVHTHG